VIACVPTVLKEVVYAADPPLRVTVPSAVDPEVKATLPVGVGPALVTFAVSVTFCPAKLGLADDVAAIAEAVWFTVTATAADVSAG
jgi:hypothetical protein